MKVFVQVVSISDVSKDIRPKIIVVNPNNWVEIINFLDGKNTIQYLYITTGVSLDNLLKTFEDYVGDLVIYTPVTPTTTVLSRFTRVVNRVPVKEVELFEPSYTEEVFKKLKEALNGY